VVGIRTVRGIFFILLRCNKDFNNNGAISGWCLDLCMFCLSCSTSLTSHMRFVHCHGCLILDAGNGISKERRFLKVRFKQLIYKFFILFWMAHSRIIKTYTYIFLNIYSIWTDINLGVLTTVVRKWQNVYVFKIYFYL